MPKKRLIALAALVAAAVAALYWLRPLPEPVYQGRRLSKWLTVYDTVSPTSPPFTSQDAAEAIRHMGTNAIPTLLRMIAAHDSALKIRVMEILRKQTFIKVSHVNADNLSCQAREGFKVLGADACSAVPALNAIYHRSSDWAVRNNVICTLGNIGPTAKDAVPSLISATTNRDWVTLGNAVDALGKIHAQPKLTVPALVRMLKYVGPHGYSDNTSYSIRWGAVDGLKLFAADARPAVPELILALTNSNIDLRQCITNALLAIDPTAAAKAGVR